MMEKTLTQSRLKEVSKVLVVEDNKANQQYLTGLLDQWKLTYDLANNGKEALLLIAKCMYKAVLMDIRMPEMDGYETTLKIRSMQFNANVDVPIIALTASTLVDERERALAVGMNYHLSKPFTPEDLGLVLTKYNIIEAMEKETYNEFSFSPSLDGEYLDEFYQGDVQRAILMFDVFLKVIDGEMVTLEDLKDQEDWEGFSGQAHKIKPNFKMVGLQGFSEKMREFEGAKKDPDLRKMISLQFDETKKEFEGLREIIVNELERLKEFGQQ